MAKNDKVVRVTPKAIRMLKGLSALHGVPMWQMATAAIIESCEEALDNWAADEKPKA